MTEPAPVRRVMLVEDDEPLRLAVVQGLELAGFTVGAFADAEQALANLDDYADAAIVSDVRLPRMDGLQFLAAVRELDPDAPVVIVTGHGDVPMAVAALKQGAYDFLTKPFAIDHLAATLDRALERRRLVAENRRLRAIVAEQDGPLIGASPAMVGVRAAIRRYAAADVDALVTGESGTGKDLVGAMLHRQGPRRARPLVAIDLAAAPAEQVELDLFGHAADSVPHTRLARAGQLVSASGGTLLIDRIERASSTLQARLLRALEEREVMPTGADRAEPINPRVVAMTAVDLEHEVAAGRFDAALFRRLAAAHIQLPPVRARGDDRLLLFAQFVDEARVELGQPDAAITEADRAALLAGDWPGNVRELRQFAFAAALGGGNAPAPTTAPSLRERTASFERLVITDALTRTGGNVVAALALLGTPRKTLYDKFARYGIVPEHFRP